MPGARRPAELGTTRSGGPLSQRWRPPLGVKYDDGGRDREQVAQGEFAQGGRGVRLRLRVQVDADRVVRRRGRRRCRSPSPRARRRRVRGCGRGRWRRRRPRGRAAALAVAGGRCRVVAVGERRAGSFVRDRGMTASPRSAADRACATASVVACRSVVAMALCSYVCSRKGRAGARDAPGRGAGRRKCRNASPLAALGEELSALLPRLGRKASKGVYRLVITLEGESGLPGGSPGIRWATLITRRRAQRRGGRPTALAKAPLRTHFGSTTALLPLYFTYFTRCRPQAGAHLFWRNTWQASVPPASSPLSPPFRSPPPSSAAWRRRTTEPSPDDGSNATASEAFAGILGSGVGGGQQRQLVHHAAAGGRLGGLEPEQHRAGRRLRVHGDQPGQRERGRQLHPAVVVG